MIKRYPFQHLIAQVDRRIAALAIGASLALMGALLGLALAFLGPLYTAALLVALAGGIWMLAGLENALWSVVAIIAILPYATLPFKIVVTPTFLDIALGAFFFLYIGEWMTGERRRLTTTPVHALVVLFMALSVFSFVAGLRYAGPTSASVRHFAELLLSIAFALVLVDVLKDFAQLRRFVRVVMLIGTAAALIAIALWLLPDSTAEGILRRLSVIGYPDSGIIRYVEENPDLPERAIGTTADPNALGGLLVMIAALITPQAISRSPILFGKRWPAVLMVGVLAVALVLTFSRGSMLAFAIALVFIATIRSRKMLLILLAAAALFLVLPWTQFYVTRLVEGFQGADLATQMRFGEYKDALRLISRYPLLGVGFTGTPDIDLYLGVANVYLTIASNMGLLGLSAFLLLIGAVFAYAWHAYPHTTAIPGLRAILLGLMAGLIGALANGIFDHYFFNLEFHPAITILWTFIGLTLTSSRIALAEAERQKQHGKALATSPLM